MPQPPTPDAQRVARRRPHYIAATFYALIALVGVRRRCCRRPGNVSAKERRPNRSPRRSSGQPLQVWDFLTSARAGVLAAWIAAVLTLAYLYQSSADVPPTPAAPT